MLVLVSWPHAQGTTPASPLTIVTREGRRPVPTTLLNGQEFIALDELASLFQLTVREDALVGGITVTSQGPDDRCVRRSSDGIGQWTRGHVARARRSRRTATVRPDRFHPARPGSHLRFADRPPARASRLLIVGAIRVARVVVRIDAAGPPTRATIEVTPALLVSAAFDAGRVLVRIEADAARRAAAARSRRADRADPNWRSNNDGCDCAQRARRDAAGVHDHEHGSYARVDRNTARGAVAGHQCIARSRHQATPPPSCTGPGRTAAASSRESHRETADDGD